MDYSELRRQEIRSLREVSSPLPIWMRVPAFPETTQEFCKRAGDPRSNARELASIVEKDSGLTCELLRQVNSSSGSLRHKVVDTQQAISILGIHRAKLTLMQASAQLILSGKNTRDFDCTQFAQACVQRGVFASLVARNIGADQDLARSGATLCDCVLPLIDCHHDDLYSEYKCTSSEVAISVDQHEKKTIGFTHPYAAAEICVGWKFPDDLVCCILFHHTPLRRLIELGCGGTALVAVRLSCLLPGYFIQEPQGLDSLIQIIEHFPSMDIIDIAMEADDLVKQLCPNIEEQKSLTHIIKSQMAGAASE